jgi:peroxiredoxin
MKLKVLLAFAGIMCILSANVLAQKYQFTISGKLQNISPMPAKLYLSEIFSSGILLKARDTAEVKNGEYHFNGELKDDEAIGLNISAAYEDIEHSDRFLVFIDKGQLNILSDSTLSNFTVSGSAAKAQQQFEDMKKNMNAELAAVKKLMAGEGFKTDKKLQAEVQSKNSHALGQGMSDMYGYVKKNPQNRISPYATLFLIELPFLQLPGKDTLMRLLPPRARKDKLGQAVERAYLRSKNTTDSLTNAAIARNKEAMSKIVMGTQAPDFTANDVNGKPVSLSSFSGKYVLIDFWASWCAPCRVENPGLVKTYNKYKDKGFTIISVSLDTEATRGAWLRAIAKDGLSWTQVSDLKGWKSDINQLYGIGIIPQNFLLDTNGTLIGKNLQNGELSTKLGSILK